MELGEWFLGFAYASVISIVIWFVVLFLFDKGEEAFIALVVAVFVFNAILYGLGYLTMYIPMPVPRPVVGVIIMALCFIAINLTFYRVGMGRSLVELFIKTLAWTTAFFQIFSSRLSSREEWVNMNVAQGLDHLSRREEWMKMNAGQEPDHEKDREQKRQPEWSERKPTESTSPIQERTRSYLDIRDPLREGQGKSVIRAQVEAILDNLRASTAVKVYENLARYWKAVKEAHDAARAARESIARTTPEEANQIDKRIRHERELSEKQMEIERLQKELEKVKLEQQLKAIKESSPSRQHKGEQFREFLQRQYEKEIMKIKSEYMFYKRLEELEQELISQNPGKEAEIRDFIHQKRQEAKLRFLRDSDKEDW
ncbi:MAG: hypothetical protein QXP01_00715 [Candidatus Hadarchaeum sp.]